jgi:signal transduction histidine kinase
MKIKAKKRFIWTAAFGFCFWILGFYLFHFQLHSEIEQGKVTEFEEAFHEKTEELNEALIQFAHHYSTKKTKDQKFRLAQQMEEETGFSFFSFNADTMDLWSTSRIELPNPSDSYWEQHVIVLLENGWYKVATHREEERLFACTFLVKNEYNYENEDLVNEFSHELAPNLKGSISFDDKGFAVRNQKGEKLFSIVPTEEVEKDETLEIIIFFCYLLGFLILFQLLINAFQKILITRPLTLILFPLTIVLLRFIWLKAGMKGIFWEFELFNPELFASSEFAPSLGDLIINVSIFYFLVHFLLKRTRNWFEKGNLRLKLVVFVVPLFLGSFYVAFQINEIIYSLVYNSNISFDLERLFDLTLYSFICIALIGASFYAYFKLIQYIIIQLKKSQFEWNRLAFLWVLSSFLYVLIDQIYFNQSLLTSFWPIFLSGSLLWFHFKEKDYKFAHVISILAFIAFYASFILQGYSLDEERKIRKFQAEKIAEDEDVVSEIDYADLKAKLDKDRFILPFFAGGFDQSEFSEILEDEYFFRLKDKYQLKFFLFDAEKHLRDDPSNYDIQNFERFEEIIEESGESSSVAEGLFFIPDYTDKLTYLSRHVIEHKDSVYGYLYTEFRSKKFPEDIGLPSLLLDDRTPTIDQFKNYSIAKYVDEQLVSRKGDYNYPTVVSSWFKDVNGYRNKGEYSHYIHKDDHGKYTIVSKEITTNLALFTSFSYLLIIYGILLLIPLGYNQLQKEISLNKIKLNVKIQAVLIGLILITLVAFAIGAGTYVAQQNLETNKDLIKEKIGSVRTELENKLKEKEKLTKDDSDYLEFLLKKFSNVFVTDINIFDKKGDLLASSQPKIYSQGLISKKMNPEAYRGISLNNQSDYINQESIGRLNFLSAYKPFHNQNGEFLAFVNAQYISRQHDFENQISGFLLAIINIMVFMLAFSTILSITVSNSLVQPLKYIQESLKSVQIGAASKPIEYSREDEIGELVKAYNKKVEELQKNAEVLAKSERESAWREMAKQVAHEIKNPLTPMKLSIQHLTRSIKLADEESEEKLQRISRSLIEQIDALTKIANEFSNFAKMPKAKEIELNLSEILENTVAVFGEHENAEIKLTVEPTAPPIVWADKNLLLRVFNNLVKNALQAVPKGKDAYITVILVEKEDVYEVRVKDNGKGIKPEERAKIFVPYFTTKSKGTGLGLAMSKQIIESMNGTIRFETEVNHGTTFFVTFPKLNK